MRGSHNLGIAVLSEVTKLTIFFNENLGSSGKASACGVGYPGRGNGVERVCMFWNMY